MGISSIPAPLPGMADTMPMPESATGTSGLIYGEGRAAARHFANEIVMGEHGRQRFREAVFGGTIGRVLRTSQIPLLMMR